MLTINIWQLIKTKNDKMHDMLVFALSALLIFIGLCMALIVSGK